MTLALFFAGAMFIYAQTVTGTVQDETGPLPGANILEKGTTNGTTSDFDGKFTLEVKEGTGTLVISFVGYSNKSVKFTVAAGQTQDLGTIVLQSDNTLEEVVLVGVGVIDLAEGRKTPIAVSTVRAEEIQQKIGTQDVTATLVNTPSIYVAGQAGGFGDSRIAVRGFGQDNTAYLLNGQPINGMEDGKMYWSNWSGINDIASAIQIQRGLGSSKLAISSVGGTTNFVTRTTDRREGGYAYFGVANDSYFKSTLSYSSGKSENGFGASVMLSHWQGDGYNDGTKGKGQTYFISLGYTPNETHNFNFLLTGAPQWHDQNFAKPISDYLEHGRRYNNNWGTYKGKYMTERRNFYHKPIANLNWDYNINDNTSLSTVLYASWGRGGGTGNRGNRIRTDEGYIDYDAIYDYNLSVPNGAGGYFAAGGGYVTRASMNLHSWYGLVSNLETQLGENLSWNIGVDLRTYYGEHFRVVEDFHGLQSWKENIRLRDQNNNHETYGSFGTYKFVETRKSLEANPWDALFANFDEKDKIAYSNDERISYGGAFTQLEYATDVFSVFAQGSVSNQYHQRFDHYQYADESLINGTSPQWTGEPLPANIEPGVDSKKVENFGFNIKGGASVFINDQNSIFVNAGMYSRQPYHDNIYLNFTNQVNPLTKNEKILGLEAGYSFKSPVFSANLNLYRTSWKDRVTTTSEVVDDVVTFTTNEGVEQLHQGVEIDFTSKPIDRLRLKGFLSYGDWEYKGEVITRITDEERNVIGTETEDVDGGKVGDAAQFTAGLGFDFDITENFSIDSDYRHYDNLYADVGAVKENLKLPSYGLVDAGLSYRWIVGQKNNSLNFRLNINNLLNKIYLSEARTNIMADDLIDSDDPSQGTYRSNDMLYQGIATRNQVYFGYGRTWNFGVRFKF